MTHLEAIQAGLAACELDAMLLTSAAARHYACGYGAGEGLLLVSRSGAWYCAEPLSLPAAVRCVHGAAVCPVQGSFGEALAGLAAREGLGLIGFEETRVSVAELWMLQGGTAAKLIPAEELLASLRIRKDAEEVRLLRLAQRRSESLCRELLGAACAGVRESDLCGRFYSRLAGDEAAFPPVAAFGSRSAFPHGLPGDAALGEGDMLLLDVGVRVSGYGGDLSRTCALGSASTEQREAYSAVYAAQRAAAAALRGGVEAGEVELAAQKALEACGFGGLMPHSLGHGIGLEAHEPPFFAPGEAIPAGAVVALEPALYLPGGFGVRIEDCYLVTAHGCEPLAAGLAAPEALPILPAERSVSVKYMRKPEK